MPQLLVDWVFLHLQAKCVLFLTGEFFRLSVVVIIGEFVYVLTLYVRTLSGVFWKEPVSDSGICHNCLLIGYFDCALILDLLLVAVFALLPPVAFSELFTS